MESFINKSQAKQLSVVVFVQPLDEKYGKNKKLRR